MAVVNPPLYVAAGSHSAELDRRAHRALIGGVSGVVGAADLLVTQNGSPNMSVNVATGDAFVLGTQATYQGAYFCENQGAVNLAIGAAHATLPRRDLIVLRVNDASYSGALNNCALEVVAGTANASPVDPTAPANSIVLARVAVAATVTTILTANLTDLRPRASGLGGFIVCTSATRPSAPFEGMIIFETDTNRALAYSGTAWTGLGAWDVPPPQFFQAATAGAGPTSLTSIITNNAVLVAPYPLTMVVTAFGDMGANGASNTVSLTIQDEAGANIQASQGGLVGSLVTVKNYSISEGKLWNVVGKKDYAAGATCGFRLMYKVDVSNIFIGAGVMVQFFPKTS